MSLEPESTVLDGNAFADAEGVTMPSTPDGRPGFLSDLIVELGFADAATVDATVERSRLAGRKAETMMVENGTITEEQLALATAERHGLPYVNISKFAVDERTQRLIGADTARRYRAAPISFDSDGALIVALADPLDALAASDIGVITKSEVRPVVATDTAIEAILATMPARPRVRMSEPRSETMPAGGETSAGPATDPSAWTLSRSIKTPPAVEDSSREHSAGALADAGAQIERLEAELAEERRARRELELQLASAIAEAQAASREVAATRSELSDELDAPPPRLDVPAPE